MKQLFCDVCKKVIANPIPTHTCFHIADMDICESCKDELDAALRPTVRTKAPFDYRWADELTLKLLRDGMQRGRIESKARR